MTQNTQTTAERIKGIIDDATWAMPSEARIQGTGGAAQTIAAEIDAITAELAQRTLERDAAQETLGMCQRWSDDTAKQMAARLAETTAKVDTLTADNAQANQWLVNGVAKIAGLEKQLAEARAEVATLTAQLAAARMEIESLKANVSGWQIKAGDVGNKLARAEQGAQRLTAERDEARDKLIEVRDTLHHTNNEFAVILRERNEARAEVKAGDAGNKLVRSEQEAQRLTRMRDFERDAAGTMADQYSILAEERNALKADVERLRPAAEAWEAQEVYDSLTGYEPNLPDIWQKRQAAAARARAAKGEK